MARKLILPILGLGVALYGLQLLVVAFWNVFPVAEERSAGKVYRLQRGFGGAADLQPFIGLLPVLGETVTLTITDESTGEVDTQNHDDVPSVFREYEQVFGRR